MRPPGRQGPTVSEGVVVSGPGKPEVRVPEGAAGAALVIRDLVVGDGPEALPGRVVQVHYVGVVYASGREFDSSWEQDRPFKFAVGGGKAVKGFDRGVRGMKAGGRREIVVPPRLGYGKQSPSAAIPADSTLIFVVDLLTVVAPGATTPRSS
ncbi:MULTISPECIES: FKBP-type peptidyl-prolyl cis-trans isomerase [unclassified Streptomyces]|uniref:FKBP-type peptidyl-prolyl cis-trans isomerase n=1 Tax=unclassified Streptomyces TaxID=2593676 RepID=UPI000DADFA9C|nr:MULTISPECIES: FKBP-type peptidyl-prolyl cis-trans isomerase [unclassified Streptomyces]PZT73660.1 FKBP-type peptidyl-prolyl cis-trans isomerase [Streptomyces sp. AC1-42T]PZT83346.1 FKBP-type peptidyl-prolyl cis-trans isomerase [Streptomyces sp. AC1-42W]